MDSTSQFDQDEMNILTEAARAQAEADAAMLKEAQAADAAAGTAAAAPSPAPAPATETAAAPAAAPAPAADAATAAAPAPAQSPAAAAPAAATEKAAGDLRPALRASRRAERHLAQKLERALQELEEVKKAAPATAPASKRPGDDVMRDVEAYAAPAAEYIKELEGQVQELSTKVGTAAPAAQAEPLFVPEYIPDAALQAVVDEIDDLSDWQNSASHQNLWTAAKKMDDLLAEAPAWRGKPDKERLQEVVRRVKQEFAEPAGAAQKTRATAADAERVIAAIPAAAAPVTIGDLRGGSTPDHSTIPDYHKMARDGMTDEEIMASLGP